MNTFDEPRTKTGYLRQGKATITKRRLELRDMLWEPIKKELRDYFSTHWGSANRAARFLGCHPSQIHRFTCGTCEHDQEPVFTTGLAILLWYYYDKRTQTASKN